MDGLRTVRPGPLDRTVRQVALLAHITAVLFAGRLAHELSRDLHISLLVQVALRGIVSALFFLAGQSFLLAGRVSIRRLAPGSR